MLLADMDRRHTKKVVSRLLHQSIIELCKASVPQEPHVQIDGIVCINIGDDDDDQIVVKVHEQIGGLRSVSHVSSSQNADGQQRRDDYFKLSEYQRKRKNIHSIASAASAKCIRIAEAENEVESSTADYSGLEKLWKSDMQLLSTIKTEIPSEEEPSDIERFYDISQKHRVNNPEPQHAQNKSALDELIFRDFECQQCKLLMPTFEELQRHNRQEHKSNTCSSCGRSFHSFSNYQQHLKTHRRIRIGNKPKHSRTETAIKWKRCGVCREVFRTQSYIIQHLRDVHDFERHFTCTSCDEYFPNRQTFVMHRKHKHAEVQQCRCEKCDISFTYVEFKHHEKECSECDSLDDCKEQNHCKEMIQKETDDGEVSSLKDSKREKAETEGECGIKRESILKKMLMLDAASEMQVTYLKKKNRSLEQNKTTANYLQNSSGDESVSFSQSCSPADHTPQTRRMNRESHGRDIPDGSENDGDGDDEAGNNSDNDESETSLGEGSDILSMLAVPDIHALLEATRDQAYCHAGALGRAGPHACQGPYRCQTCFFVIDDFEDFERHCFEMHCRYVCTYCAQTFANRRNLQRHIRRHVGDMPYACDECGQRFYRDDNLRRHKLKHMTSVRFVCAYCSTPFENKNKLTSHLIGGHAIDVLKVTDQEVMKHVILKDDPVPLSHTGSTEHSSE